MGMRDTALKSAETEKLGYYDFMAYLGVPYFHVGGMRSTDELLAMCQIDNSKRVLVVGCGTGYTTCRIAKERGSEVLGIDIAKLMVSRAKERVEKEVLKNKVKLVLGDAYRLPFRDNTFDTVLTEFVSIFLDKQKVLKEYVRVLRPNGFLGVNELYKSEEMPQEVRQSIAVAEGMFEKAIGLPLVLPTPSDWKAWFVDSELKNIQLKQTHHIVGLAEYTKAVGGAIEMLKLNLRLIYYMLSSKVLRSRLRSVRKSSITLLRDRKNKQYVGVVLCIGQK